MVAHWGNYWALLVGLGSQYSGAGPLAAEVATVATKLSRWQLVLLEIGALID